jgi:hypothetical protein
LTLICKTIKKYERLNGRRRQNDEQKN